MIFYPEFCFKKASATPLYFVTKCFLDSPSFFMMYLGKLKCDILFPWLFPERIFWSNEKEI
jgi:hypothetical protein